MIEEKEKDRSNIRQFPTQIRVCAPVPPNQKGKSMPFVCMCVKIQRFNTHTPLSLSIRHSHILLPNPSLSAFSNTILISKPWASTRSSLSLPSPPPQNSPLRLYCCQMHKSASSCRAHMCVYVYVCLFMAKMMGFALKVAQR